MLSRPPLLHSQLAQLAPLGLVSVYDLALIKNLCERITTEQDPKKVNGLLNLLRVVIRENSEDAWLRLGFAKKKLLTDPPR